MALNKTDYLAYLDCPMHLWALNNDQLDPQSKDEFVELLVEQGYEVEIIGKQYIKDYILAPRHLDILNAQHFQEEETYYSKDKMYEARIDTLVWNPASESYDLIEVKSSTHIGGKRSKYILDATFQYLVLTDTINIGRVFILHPNREYIREGELDILEYFHLEDITDEVTRLRSDVLKEREDAFNVIQTHRPNLVPTCLKPKDCPCSKLCHPNKPEYSIYDITGIRKKKKLALLDEDISAIDDIPSKIAQSLFKGRAKKQIEVTQNRTTYIDTESIAKELDSLTFPLYFIDYETSNKAIPLYNGYSPYTHIPVQWSLHILYESGELMHHEFLHTTNSDPVHDFTQHMMNVIGDTGSIIVWHKPFEMMINREAGERIQEYADFYNSINSRVYDLKEVFSQGYYVDYRFKGSCSIKKVLPILVPDMSYEDMEVGNGTQAIQAWDRMVLDESTPLQEREAIKNQLLAYCKQDTLAMVRIYQELIKQTKQKEIQKTQPSLF